MIEEATLHHVLAVFARGAIGADCMGWLRMIADHAAAAIATARAFAEIDQFEGQLRVIARAQDVLGLDVAMGQIMAQENGRRPTGGLRLATMTHFSIVLT